MNGYHLEPGRDASCLSTITYYPGPFDGYALDVHDPTACLDAHMHLMFLCVIFLYILITYIHSLRGPTVYVNYEIPTYAVMPECPGICSAAKPC